MTNPAKTITQHAGHGAHLHRSGYLIIGLCKLGGQILRRWLVDAAGSAK